MVVGEKQQPETDLSDQQCLCQGQQVRDDAARLPTAVVSEPGERGGAPGRREDEECHGAVRRYHRRRTLQGGST